MTSAPHDTPLASTFPAVTHDQWRAMVDKALKGADFDKRLVARTADGIRVDPLYTRRDAIADASTAIPGAAPFTRGTFATRSGLGWDIRAIVIESDPGEANRAILADLEGGVNSIALQCGPTALPPTQDALATALSGVILDACPIILIAGEQAFDAATALNAVWTNRGIKPEARLGAFGADPLGTLALQGRLTEPVETALARAVALVKMSEAMPHVSAITADGVPYHVAGASEAQELGCLLASLVAYLRACENAGIPPKDAVPKFTIALAADADEFSTIAKLRAARRLVWRIADACGAGDAAKFIPLACPTSYRMMAKRDSWTNILRTTIACTGAALGGADAICVLPFTFALGKPDAFARRVARNIQIVCQEESNLGRVTDPAGGSWYVERLTDEFAKKGWEMFQEIEARGGMLSALTSGFIQDQIAKTAEARAKAIATGKLELTGVNAFPLLGDDGVHAAPWPRPPAHPVKPALEVTPLKVHRLGAAFEELRDAADAYAKRAGKPLTVFLASMGDVIDHNVRTTWVKNYLAAGGIATLISDGYKTADDAAKAFKASGATAACICSSDALYATHSEATARALKSAGAKLILQAGRPGDNEANYKSAGVDQFLFAGADAVQTLNALHAEIAKR